MNISNIINVSNGNNVIEVINVINVMHHHSPCHPEQSEGPALTHGRAGTRSGSLVAFAPRDDAGKRMCHCGERQSGPFVRAGDH
ncbi:MAG: hypothetical protein IT517_08450 [Burkholderiales bacterium]|nr:hypothetical protein [Burkholderiales bacterium]